MQRAKEQVQRQTTGTPREEGKRQGVNRASLSVKTTLRAGCCSYLPSKLQACCKTIMPYLKAL